MGQSLKKPSTGNYETIKQEGIEKIVEDLKIGESESEFYGAIYEAVEKINKKLGYTQVKAPAKETLEKLYKKHHKAGSPLERDEFQKIMEEVIKGTELTGLGSKDIVLYIFGVPASTLFIKNAVMPNLVSNEVFIPGVTSLTAFVLALLNKI